MGIASFLGDTESPTSNYGKYVLPLAAIIEAMAKGGEPTVAGKQMQNMLNLPAAREEYRQKALERTLGLNKAESANKFREEAAAGGDLGSLYAKHNPEDAGKASYDSALKLKEIMANPQRMTDFQRKFAAVKDAHPDWDDQKVLDYTLVPSSQIGPSDEKVEGQKKLSEAGALGANTPTAGAAKADVAKTVASAEIGPKLYLKQMENKMEGDKGRNDAIKAKEIVNAQLDNSLDVLIDAYNKVPDAYKGYLGGAAGEANITQLVQSPQTQALVQTYKTTRDKMSREIAKMIEGGKMSDQDAAFYQKMLGNLRMSPAQAQAAVVAMKDYGASQLKSLKESTANVNNGTSTAPKATKRWNPATGKLETIE
jgi:hypothetical protein